ncbi:hypothetical protein ACH4L5_21295 [Streptomyces sp. NPDC017405]|uniref:hypothetical protein n=1 Tax=unclassified Streptomyces TaxID=2593676 RepID=UPI00378A907B
MNVNLTIEAPYVLGPALAILFLPLGILLPLLTPAHPNSAGEFAIAAAGYEAVRKP